jgi:EmrB/QacA subfamily drug resistance transporter
VGSRRDRRTPLLAGMTLANAMVLVDQTAVPLTLPAIIHQFSVSDAQVQWVLNASLLPLASLLVLGGQLGDLMGRRRVFLFGSVLFATASALGGLAPAFTVLLLFRVLQGAGGAMMLPNTVAIVSSAFPGSERGRVLGTMGGAAAVAAALGPTIGGLLTSALSWRAVLLINVPLAIVTIVLTRRTVARDQARRQDTHVDIAGAVSLGVMLAALVFGLAQSQVWGWSSPLVLGSLILSAASGVAFGMIERASPQPLMSFGLLRRHRNYLGATLSQIIGGMAEMGLALLFPLLLILNLQLTPAEAGLALIPTTLPMIAVAPAAGRWYDRAGGRLPLVTGFAVLGTSGVLLALGVHTNEYLWIVPGLLVYGVGLAVVLTVNDPVALDTIPARHNGQASGVSATAEQFGGAIGIAALYLLFHSTYLRALRSNIEHSPGPGATPRQLDQLRNLLQAAEQSGLRPQDFPAVLDRFLIAARGASDRGYAVAFLAVTVLAAVGLILMALLVRKPRSAGTAAQGSEDHRGRGKAAAPDTPFPSELSLRWLSVPDNRRALCLPGSASTASAGSAATSFARRSRGEAIWRSWRSMT